MKITGVSITNHSGRYALNWIGAEGFRFHVWGVKRPSGMVWEDTIYKNHPITGDDRKDRMAKTMRLSRHAAANRRTFDAVILESLAGHMIAAADAAYKAEQAAEEAERKARIREIAIEKAAPQLLAIVQAVRALEEEPGILTTGRPLQSVVNAARVMLEQLGV